MIIIKNAKVILKDFIKDGFVVIDDGKIRGVESSRPETGSLPVTEIDAKGMYLSPGFIELHAHGAGGYDFLGGTAETMAVAAKYHMRHGVTTILPTITAFDEEEFILGIDNFKAAKATMADGPNLNGIHFEAPYINVNQRGAFEAKYIKDPNPAEYKKIVEYADGAVTRWTAAPELPGALEFGEYISKNGILPSIGHSEAEYTQVLRAFERGYTHVTHLYSATSTVVRRGGFRFPGVIESAFLMDGLTVEIIADGCHMPPELLRMIYKIKGAEKVCLISDSLRFAGTNQTGLVYSREGRDKEILIEDGVAKLPDRSAFSGSIATADRLIRVMRNDAGVSLVDCVRMMSLTPAEIMGIGGKTGSIEYGKDADLVLFDENIEIQGVMVKGKPVYGMF